MEVLLQQYHEQGMKDLSFIIINAYDSLSELMFDELNKRVSFPVYQDNIKEDIWNLLKGGKDDMYIYDRCGRLTFYVPFPLSIIHPQQPIVGASIYATYYEDLCGKTCLISEMERSIPSDYQKSLDHIEGNNTNITDTLDIQDIKTVLENENNESINDSVVLVDDVGDEFSFLLDQNFTALDNKTDLDIFNTTAMLFNFTDETILRNTTELPDNITMITNNIIIMLEKNTTIIPENTTVQIHTKMEESYWDMVVGMFSSNKSEEKQTELQKSEISNEPTAKGRCRDPSHEQICRDWSKGKLWHAKTCCTPSDKIHRVHRHGHCRHYRVKRCKKLQPIIKCCLGTADAPTEQSLIDGVTANQENFTTVG